MTDATSIMGIPCQNPAAEMFTQEPSPNGDESFGLSWGIDLARNGTPTTGTGPITLGAGVPGFLSFAAAGIPAGTVKYALVDAPSNVGVEVGTGTLDPVAGTLTRDVVEWSINNNAHVSLSGGAQVSTPFQRLMRPRSTTGISALDTASGSIALTGGQWIKLHSSFQLPGGFRYGLFSAPPSGGFILAGQLAIACSQPNVRFDIRVMQGTTPDPNYPGMLTGNPVEIGGGVMTSYPNCSASNWVESSTTFLGYPAICEVQRGQCCAFWVEVFPQCVGACGGALVQASPSAAGGGTLPGSVSRLVVLRFGGAQSRNQ
jgi:hypothetical protein